MLYTQILVHLHTGVQYGSDIKEGLEEMIQNQTFKKDQINSKQYLTFSSDLDAKPLSH